jgi:pimeloyl-ACP methyl ester carboxylesterase
MGPRGGIPLVLLNRVRGTIDWWDPQFLDCLAAAHDVIVFDDVGVGYTTGEPRATPLRDSPTAQSNSSRHSS